ncbi:MAG: DUF1572 domain-containing protein [Gemmatimonadetes bacterium]|nr:DUF1572 domain-containing protein [Gemmatimonadota bacterium]MYE94141.1 DUF1572 domain-containing protein [Gemmatimonadota bacterium]MYJ09030.1 DUF1572 domain-containing protein [Gemmatimonadota bacterium]
MNRTLLPLIEAEFLRYKLLGERALRQVRPEELHVRGDDGNSVAIIVWHVAGNLESKFTDLLTTDGEKPWRDRDSEFEPREVSAAEVTEKWERGWRVLFGALADLTDDDLAAPITISGVQFRVDEALLRSLAHLAYHVGQIVLLARSFRGGDWEYLSIPPGESEAYNANPVLEKSSLYAENVERLEDGA